MQNYNTLTKMKITVGKEIVKDIDISIPDDATAIAVLVSGGADSAVLLYCLAVEAKQRNIPILTFTVPRHDGAALYSPGIVEQVNKLAGSSIPLPIKVGNPDLHHSIQTRSGHIEILEKYSINYVYYGSQAIADELKTLNFVFPKRPVSKSHNGTICPFFDLTKEHTLDLYFKLNITELLKFSHSCTEETVGRCNICFNCVERAWAFTRLGQTDPGNW